MQPFAHALLETFALRRGALRDALGHVIHHNPHQEAGAIQAADLEALLDAVVVLLREALLDTDPAAETLFVEQILPGVLVEEEAASGLLHVVATWSVHLCTEVDRHIGSAYRDAARVWLADFAGQWVVSLATAAAAQTPLHTGPSALHSARIRE